MRKVLRVRKDVKVRRARVKELMKLNRDAHDLVAIIIDGKRFADDEMIIALGVKAEGKKGLLWNFN